MKEQLAKAKQISQLQISGEKVPPIQIKNPLGGELIQEIQDQYQIKPILPRAGLVYSEKSNLTEVLCKPKILPLKS